MQPAIKKIDEIGKRRKGVVEPSRAVLGQTAGACLSSGFTPAGVVTRCTLAERHRLAGYDLPAGAESRRDPATGGWEFQLPQDGPALRIAVLGADLPSGGTLALAAEGALRRLYVPHESRMVIAGVALYDHLILEGAGLTGELAEPTPVAGAMLPTETMVPPRSDQRRGQDDDPPCPEMRD